MKFELWRSEDESSYTYLPRDKNYENQIRIHKKITPDIKLIWSCDAKTYFEAMQAYYDYLGCGTYKPEPEWEDIIYEK